MAKRGRPSKEELALRAKMAENATQCCDIADCCPVTDVPQPMEDPIEDLKTENVETPVIKETIEKTFSFYYKEKPDSEIKTIVVKESELTNEQEGAIWQNLITTWNNASTKAQARFVAKLLYEVGKKNGGESGTDIN